jgi:hypothetical protein
MTGWCVFVRCMNLTRLESVHQQVQYRICDHARCVRAPRAVRYVPVPGHPLPYSSTSNLRPSSSTLTPELASGPPVHLQLV